MKKIIFTLLAVAFNSSTYAGETGWKLTFQNKNTTCYSETLEMIGEPKFNYKPYKEYEKDPRQFEPVYRHFRGYFSKKKIAPFGDVEKIEFLHPNTDMNGPSISIYKFTMKDGSTDEADDNFTPLFMCKKGTVDFSSDFDREHCFESWYLKASCIDTNKVDIVDTFIRMDPNGNGKKPTNNYEKLLLVERISGDEIKSIVDQHRDNVPKILEKNQQIQIAKDAALANERKRKQDEMDALAKRGAEQAEKAIAFMDSAKRGTVMFCESPPNALLRLGEPITKTYFICDLTGEGNPVFVNYLMGTNWQIINQIKTPVETYPGNTLYQYSIQVKKN